jgi:hypothetical protein
LLIVVPGTSTVAEIEKGPVTADLLTAILAERLLGWRATPDRFLLGNRRWMPRWRFRPFRRLEDALQLLEKANVRYAVENARAGAFMARVIVGEQVATAHGTSPAAALTTALAKAIGIDVEGCE